MWHGLIIVLLFAATATAASVTIEKRGVGTAIVADGKNSCTSDMRVCTWSVDAGSTFSVSVQRDASNANLMSWGGLCAEYEDRKQCTVRLDDTAVRRYRGVYPILVGLGYAADGRCRIPGGMYDYMFFDSLQVAVNTIKSGAGSNPVECITRGYYSLAVVDSDVTISGGWTGFSPPIQGEAPMTITDTITVSTGTLTITGPVQIACGTTVVNSPLVITTTPVVVGASSCDFGLVVR
ncbi:hypothetical protein KI809_10670 [Geobacter pelophilus]|uniref:Uncharacterized protein n=1 Tax=Geoanaerobacter pelophilus TaxID=60036 RepID=A0AAW4L6U4_9BACT|nr:hypothetical protein [Geoanaerobacter pelophilus]MBT0664763.1 hypothetical protein [Geoanaerobacter pelophilus]